MHHAIRMDVSGQIIVDERGFVPRQKVNLEHWHS